jgi:hypothetical protein
MGDKISFVKKIDGILVQRCVGNVKPDVPMAI